MWLELEINSTLEEVQWQYESKDLYRKLISQWFILGSDNQHLISRNLGEVPNQQCLRKNNGEIKQSHLNTYGSDLVYSLNSD